MLLSLILIFAIAAGGFALTYLFEAEEPFMWRVAAGSVIGCAVFGTVGFVLAMLFGFNLPTVIASLIVAVAPMVLIVKKGDRRKAFERDWNAAKNKIRGAGTKRILPFIYYAAFFVLFVFFFDRAMIETDQGIFTGGSNNLGDLPYHLGAIFSFTDGANFPPQNPSFAGAKFSYPFIADFVTACFVKLGIGVRDAMFVQNVAWAFSLLVILARFVKRLIGDDFAAKLAPPILFFSGGLGFLWFFSEYAAQSKGYFEFLNALPKDYTIGDEFRWGNSLVTLFITQRSLLLGMPITLIVLGFLWKIFTDEAKPEISNFKFQISNLVVGLIAGLLPLVHLHSLAVLFVVAAFLLFLKLDKWREFVAFGVGVCIVAVPQLLWSMSGSANRATEFFAFHLGWNIGSTVEPIKFSFEDVQSVGGLIAYYLNPILSPILTWAWFWVKNTGIFIPLTWASIYWIFSPRRRKDAKETVSKKAKGKRQKETVPTNTSQSSLLLFYLPFVFLFIVSNTAKLAPWEWDNIKVLIYWFVGSLPFVAFALARAWQRGAAFKVAAAVCFVVLVLSGALDVWRTASGQINYRVFDADAVAVAGRIKASTPPNALFLNAPTYNTAVALSGRRSLMRYTGHLSSHGIDYREREDDVKRMYRGGPEALGLMERYGIEFVLVSPEERALMPNEEFFRRFPVVAESGQYRVYKVNSQAETRP